MTERQIIVVSEELSSEAARTLLREYRSYENRLGVNETKMAMKRCIEPSDLDTLMDLTYPLIGYSVVRELRSVRKSEAKSCLRVSLRI